METQELLEYRDKLLGKPDEGIEPTLDVADLRRESPEVYEALRPMIRGEEEWPTDETPTVAPAAEPEAPAEEESAPEEDPAAAEPEIDAPSVAVARDRIAARSEALKTYEAAIEAQEAILAQPEPEDEFSEDHKVWRKATNAAYREIAKINKDYNRSTANEEIEGHRTVVKKSEIAETVKTVSEEFPELKLPRAYDAMVGDYNAWAARLEANRGELDFQSAYKKFQTDAEFAKKIGPLPAGHETLFIYMLANEAHQRDGGDLEGHILALARREGVFKKARAKVADEAKTDGAKRSADALTQRATEQRPVSVKGGTQTAPVAIVQPTEKTTQEQDMAWLADLQKRIKSGAPRTASQIEQDSHRRTIVRNKWAQSAARAAY